MITGNRKSIVGLVLLLTAAALAGGGLVVRQSIERDWQAMLAALADLESELAPRRDLRAALHSGTTEELAWPHYEKAIAELTRVSDFADRTRAAARAATPEEVAARDLLLTEAATVLEHLRRGAQARDATPPMDWQAGFTAKIPRLRDVRAISDLATARFRALLDAGDDLRAVEALLDAQQLARDLATTPRLIDEMIGCALLAPDAVTDFLEAGGAAHLGQEAKDCWLAGLDQLDASLPRGSSAFEGEVLLCGRGLVSTMEVNRSLSALMGTGPTGWRPAFSWRRAIADYVIRSRDVAEEIESAFDLEGPETLRRLEQLQNELEGDKNPLFSVLLPRFRSAAESRLWSRARLAFLRHALALDLGRSPALPDDPFGHGVHVDTTPDGIRVWSTTTSGRAVEILLGS